MKSKIIKILALLTAVVMTVSLCGCGNNDGKGGSKGNGGVPDNAEVDAVTFEGLKFDIDKELDFGGKTITLSHWGSIPEPGLSKYYDDMLTLREAIGEKYNCVIKDIPGGGDNFVTELTAAFAAGQFYADLIFMPSTHLMQLAKVDGIFRPLDDYIDYSSDRFSMTQTFSQSANGKNYSYSIIEDIPCYTVIYNPALIADNGCDDPLKLYEAGKWDWNAFEAIVKACSKNVGGTQTFGVAGSNLLDGLMASNGLPIVGLDKENKGYKCNLYTDVGMETLEFVRTLTYTYTGADDTYGWHNGIETFKNSACAMIISPSYYGGNIVPSGMPFEIVPLPKGPSATKYVDYHDICDCNVVSSQSEYDTEDLLQVAFDLQRNDPTIGDTYIELSTREGRLDRFLTKNLDNNTCYFDDVQATRVFDFINDKETEHMLGYNVTDVAEIIKTKIYTPLTKGEDPRSLLTSNKSVIENALKVYSIK